MAVPVRRKLTETESTLAFLIGGGLTLIILAFLLASAQAGAGFDGSRLVFLIYLGALFIVVGVVAWMIMVHPSKNFDNWSTPLYTGHEHDEPHAETPADHAPVVAAQPVAQAAPAHPVAQTVSTSKNDDLEIIEGIGPKIAAVLKNVGIHTFADLAARQPADVEHIVRDAGVRMVGHADSWIAQAKLAAEGKMAELTEYQHQLRTKH